jgi:hypothetical protein
VISFYVLWIVERLRNFSFIISNRAKIFPVVQNALINYAKMTFKWSYVRYEVVRDPWFLGLKLEQILKNLNHSCQSCNVGFILRCNTSSFWEDIFFNWMETFQWNWRNKQCKLIYQTSKISSTYLLGEIQCAYAPAVRLRASIWASFCRYNVHNHYRQSNRITGLLDKNMLLA